MISEVDEHLEPVSTSLSHSLITNYFVDSKNLLCLMYTDTYICTHIHTYVHTNICTYVELHVRMYNLLSCMYVHTYIRMYAHTHVRIYIRTHIHMYAIRIICAISSAAVTVRCVFAL